MKTADVGRINDNGSPLINLAAQALLFKHRVRDLRPKITGRVLVVINGLVYPLYDDVHCARTVLCDQVAG